MKKNQITLMSLTFISGIIVGISILGLYSFEPVSIITEPLSTTKKVSEQDAKALFNGYYSTAAPANEVIRGFAISKEQLAALNSLAGSNASLSGFRIYMGYDATSGSVSLVVGVNSSGYDVTNTIYEVAGAGTGLCPTICDTKSAITTAANANQN